VENGADKEHTGQALMRLRRAVGVHCIDGEDVRNIQLKSLRRKVSYLPRSSAVSGSLASNLRFAKSSVSDEELEEVLRSQGCRLSAAVNDGFKKRSDRRAASSLEAAQRLAIARALYNDLGFSSFD